MRNRAVKSKMRTSIKRARLALADGDKAAAQVAVVEAISQLDKAAQKGVIHRNNAARHKAQLIKHLNAI